MKISLDELIALNDEIRALVRAGIPLDQGLRLLGSDLPGRLGVLAHSMSASLEQGQGLVDVIEDSRHGIPRLYRAIVVAGLRSGRLAIALESLSVAARQAAELRRTVIASLIYPTFLTFVASGLLSFTAAKITPLMAHAYESMGFALPTWYDRIQPAIRISPVMLVYLWMAFVLLVVAWIFWSGRAMAFHSRGVGIASFARLKYLGRMATFVRVLALLIEHGVPLDEALYLATESSGDARLRRDGNLVIERLREGGRISALPKTFPPLLAWQISNVRSNEQLARNLHQTADGFHRHALRLGEWLTVYLPIILTAVIGGTVVFLFGMIVIAPFYHLLQLLSWP